MSCPSLESLCIALAGKDPAAEVHLKSCPACASVLEAHRQLEQRLERLADPAPPPDFVARVMARVEVTPLPSQREALLGGVILAASIFLVAILLPAGALRVDAPAQKLWAVVLAWGHALQVSTSGAPMLFLVALAGLLIASAVALKALVQTPARAG